MKNHWTVKNELLKMINFQEVNQSSGYMHENVHCALISKKGWSVTILLY